MFWRKWICPKGHTNEDVEEDVAKGEALFCGSCNVYYVIEQVALGLTSYSSDPFSNLRG